MFKGLLKSNWTVDWLIIGKAEIINNTTIAAIPIKK